MRFVVAIASLVIALVMIGFGIAQRTIFAGPDRVIASTEIDSTAPVTVIDGETLNSEVGRQRIELADAPSGSIFAAYGRTIDVLGWVGDTSYNLIGYDEETGELTSELVAGETEEAPLAAGSDLWIDEFTREDLLDFTINVPSDISVIIMSDGVEPAPSAVSLSWPVDNRTPWAGPLIAGGVIFLLLGLALNIWAIIHLRRTKGPRRKPPKQPKLPRNPRYNYRKATKAVRRPTPKTIENPRGRRSAGRMTALLPVTLISALVLSGCSADNWPAFMGGTVAETSTPMATAKAEDGEALQTPAVTVPQLKDIMADVAKVAETGDADLDPKALESRFTGAALQLRQANYAIRKVDNSIDPLPPIPGSPVALTLPQQSDTWPRTVFTVIQDEAEAPAETPAPSGEPTPSAPPTPAAAEAEAAPAEAAIIPTAVMLVQETPRDNYKVAYSIPLEADHVLPSVPGEDIGTVRPLPDVKFFLIPPGDVGTAYADIMATGEKSVYFEMFDLENDSLMPTIGVDGKAARKADLPKDLTLTFANIKGAGEPIALATSDSGALVAVNVSESETVKPKGTGSQLSPEKATKALSGVKTTTKGVVATYSYNLLFYVPPVSTTDKIELLGFSQGLVAAKEL